MENTIPTAQDSLTMENPALRNLTVTIPVDEYKILLEASQREKLLLASFNKAAHGTKYYPFQLDCDILETAFSLLYPGWYEDIYAKCEAEHQAAKAGGES